MLRRNLVHAVRYPLILYMIGIPVVFLLLFVYAFGGTLGAGLPGGGDTARRTWPTSFPASSSSPSAVAGSSRRSRWRRT